MSNSKSTLPSLSFINQDSFENNLSQKSAYDIMENDVNQGFLQYKTIFTLALCYCLGAMYLLIPALLYQDPVFMCGEHLCTKQQYNIYEGEKYIDLENSINSITKEFQLYGEQEYLQSIGISMTSFGSLVGCLYFGQIVDEKGRKYSFRLSWSIVVLGGILQIASKSIASVLIATFFVGFGVLGFISVATVYLSEITAKELKAKAVSIVFIFFSLSQILVYFECQITTDWRQIISLYFLLPSMLVLFLVYQLIESPTFLASKNKTSETAQLINYIAKCNNQELQIQESQIKLQKVKKYNFGTLFKYQSLRKLTTSHTCLKIAANLLYFGISLSLSLVGNDFVTNILYIGIVDIIGYITIGYICKVLPRKMGYIITIFLTVFFLLGIVMIELPQECYCKKDCIQIKYHLILLMLARFAINISYSFQIIWQNELFPIPIKGTAVGLINSLGMLGPQSVPFIQQFCTMLSINPLMGLCVIPLIFVLPAFLLKETKGLDFEQEIEEEKDTIVESLIELQKMPSTGSSDSEDIESRTKQLQAKLLM